MYAPLMPRSCLWLTQNGLNKSFNFSIVNSFSIEKFIISNSCFLNWIIVYIQILDISVFFQNTTLVQYKGQVQEGVYSLQRFDTCRSM